MAEPPLARDDPDGDIGSHVAVLAMSRVVGPAQASSLRAAATPLHRAHLPGAAAQRLVGLHVTGAVPADVVAVAQPARRHGAVAALDGADPGLPGRVGLQQAVPVPLLVVAATQPPREGRPVA